MTAKFEERRTELYIGDLLWMVANHYYELNTPTPTEYELKLKNRDNRSAEQIKSDILRQLRG